MQLLFASALQMTDLLHNRFCFRLLIFSACTFDAILHLLNVSNYLRTNSRSFYDSN